MQTEAISYGEAIREGFAYLLENYPDVFIIGQGLWSPWYVGNSMTDLDKEFGVERVIDTPVSEAACTGAAVGAAIAGMKPVVVHPRMDFMLYAIDPIVNQAAKWSSMFGGQANAPVTIRAIINRGGEQGAQHSQALHAWFAHIPGLRVVMPSTPRDARDLLVASVLCKDPVVFIDDRWLYEEADVLPPIDPTISLADISPQVLRSGKDLTVVASGYSTSLALKAANNLTEHGIDAEVIDVRVLNPLKPSEILRSVEKTGRLLVVDSGWQHSGFSAELIATVVENPKTALLKTPPARVALPDAPAPSSELLEKSYYPSVATVESAIRRQFIL